MSYMNAEPIRSFLLKSGVSADWASRHLGISERHTFRIKAGLTPQIRESLLFRFQRMKSAIEGGILRIETAKEAEKRSRFEGGQSGIPGVHWHGRTGRWKAWCQGTCLGYWLTKEEAATAIIRYLVTGEETCRYPRRRAAAMRRHHGEESA